MPWDFHPLISRLLWPLHGVESLPRPAKGSSALQPPLTIVIPTDSCKSSSVTPNTPSPGALPCVLVAQKHFQSPRAGAVRGTVLFCLCSTYRFIGQTLPYLCFQLLQNKLRILTCDILHSIYTGVTEKNSLFLFRNTEKIPLGCPFPRQNSMTDFW